MLGPGGLIGGVFAVLGSFFFVAGVVKTIDANDIAANGIRAEGEVVSVNRKPGSRGRGG